MNSILDRFPQPSTGFIPKTALDVFALRLAQKLSDAPAAWHYARLVHNHSESKLLTAYRRTIRKGSEGELGKRFHIELENVRDNGGDTRSANLLALRIERRSIGAAVFYGEGLEYTQVRQLSSVKEKALAGALSFVDWLVETFPIESAALETIPNGHEIQRRSLTNRITEALRSRMLPIWQVPKTQLFEACGYPPLRSRKELRATVTAIWPILTEARSKNLIHDAAALGLYVQTERLFIINEAHP